MIFSIYEFMTTILDLSTSITRSSVRVPDDSSRPWYFHDVAVCNVLLCSLPELVFSKYHVMLSLKLYFTSHILSYDVFWFPCPAAQSLIILCQT